MQPSQTVDTPSNVGDPSAHTCEKGLSSSNPILLVGVEYRIRFGAESALHLEMKAAVASRLREEGFGVLVEPPFPPLRGLWWSRYRPDLFGFKRDKTHLEYVFAECETNPATQRILRKRIDSVGWQSTLLEEMRVRFLLVIPHGKLSRICTSKIRSVWDVWTYENLSGRVQVYPRLAAG